MNSKATFTQLAATFISVAMIAPAVIADVPAPAARRAMAPIPVAATPLAEAAKAHVETANAALWLAFDAAPAATMRARLSDLPKTRATGANGDRDKRQMIGAVRTLADAERKIALDQLTWTALPDGARAARVRIEIEGATSVRLGYRLEGGLSGDAVRFTSNRFEAVDAGDTSKRTQATRWTNIFDGNVAVIEVRVGPGAATSGQSIVIEHAVGLDVKSDLSKRESDIGDAQSCHVDLACVTSPSQALLDAAKSVAKLVYQSGGSTYLCTGTLIANAQARPLIYTAAHCIGDQSEASSLTTYWAFQAATCGNRAVPSFQRITSGGQLLFADPRIDVSVVEMNSSPPNNAFFAGWNADVGRRNTSVTALHHPNGDLMKYTSGATVGYTNVENITNPSRLPGDKTSSYWTTLWNQGSTEGGSSGSGLFTFEAPGALCPNGCYLLRGTLSQGSAECSNPQGTDKYGRLDLALPYIASIIDPASQPVAMEGSIATEYYNVTNDHYFMTADPAEAGSLDQPNTRITGWYRTGEQLGVYRAGTPSTAPVCRFFGDIRNGGPNSHFYTADAGECSFVARPGSGWLRESVEAFRVALPNGATCPAGTRPLYRAYNYHNTPTYRNTLTGQLGYDSNHRYFTNVDTFDFMLEKDTWGLEPVGRVPVMCVR